MERFDIARYISDENSICREERQFALYLHNILLGIKAGKITGGDSEKILPACGLGDVEIVDVFYEATFMRDISYIQDRSSFNFALLDYIRRQKPFKMATAEVLERKVIFNNGKKETLQPLSDIHLGSVGKKRLEKLRIEKDAKDALETARAMMNSKPDLAVLYRRGERGSFLKLIECKYTSNESGKEIKQTDAQKLIAGFLCDVLFENVSLDSEDSSVKLVRFLSKLSPESDKGKEGEGNIEIADLISLNSRIFS